MSQEEEPARRCYYDRDLLRKANGLSESMFKSCFRMGRQTCAEFVVEMEPHLPIGRSGNGRSIIPKERLLMFLFYAGGDIRHRHGAFSFNAGKSAVDENCRIVLDAIFNNLVKKYISLPNYEEGKNESVLFSSRSGYPQIVVAAADGTLIPVGGSFLPTASNALLLFFFIHNTCMAELNWTFSL